MKVFHKITEIKGIALALGFFDGVHVGHKKILSTLVKKARIMGVKTGVITFERNPADYFSDSDTPSIQNYKDKELILEGMGIDYLFELDFELYKDMEAMDYLQNVLIKNFEPRLIVVGYNHTFGKKRLGTPMLLKENAKALDYRCIVVPEQRYKKTTTISSSLIRKTISTGQLKITKSLLGRYFSLKNSVIKGDGKARELGYRTANIIWPDSMVKLPYGVYFGYVQINARFFHALISWGNKPTLTSGKDEIIEAHIYRFNRAIYGKIINIIFVKKLRNEEKFSSIDELKAQIKKDYSFFEKWAQKHRISY